MLRCRHSTDRPSSQRVFRLWLAVPAVCCSTHGSAVRYIQLWLRHPSLMLLAVPSAFILLAESMIAIAFARNWHLSWWEWHVLMLAAFGLVALSARASWREERFAELYLSQTSAGSREISVLFADLQGFTAFSETHEPEEVTRMLNEYFAVAVPAVKTPYGGDVDRIIGDALMVTFNKRGDQPDHAERAAGRRTCAARSDLPPGRASIQTGRGSGWGSTRDRYRSVCWVPRGAYAHDRRRHGQHRLPHRGPGPSGRCGYRPGYQGEAAERCHNPTGELQLKGKQDPLPVHVLTSLRRDSQV